MTADYYAAGQLGSFGGIPIYVTKNLPPGTDVMMVDSAVYVRSLEGFKWRLLIDNTRRHIKKDLAAIVAAAEKRLALTPRKAAS